MKTVEQIIKSRPVFLHDWSKSKSFGVIMDFENVFITLDEYKSNKSPHSNIESWEQHKKDAQKALLIHAKEKILFATYTYENYSGEAWVLFFKGKTLYEVNGGHCSCNGLEGQWSPEKVSLKELENRVKNGTFGEDNYNGGSFKTELKKFLGIK